MLDDVRSQCLDGRLGPADGVDHPQAGAPELGRNVNQNVTALTAADRITIEAWVNTLSWPTRAVVCRKEGSYILYNYSGGFSWYLFGPDNRLQHDIAGTLGNGSWGYIVGTYDKDAGADNQRLYLNGARVAQMSDTLPIDLNSAALASDGM